MTRTVIRIEDDSPCPLIGLMLGHEDADRVWVAWGDAQYSDLPWAEARIEYLDQLAPPPTIGPVHQYPGNKRWGTHAKPHVGCWCYE